MGNGAASQRGERWKWEGEEGVLVHLKGFVEVFTKETISARSVLMANPKHLVCRAQDLAFWQTKKLQADDYLHTGNVYVVIPISVIDSDCSVARIASMALRIVGLAKNKSSFVRIDEGMRSSALNLCDNEEARIALQNHVEHRNMMKKWRPPLVTIPEVEKNIQNPLLVS